MEPRWISFTEMRSPEIIGQIGGTDQKFLSLSRESENWENYIIELAFIPAIRVQKDRVARPTLRDISKMSKKFIKVFTERAVHSPSASRATIWEKWALLNFLADERLFEWLAYMLTDKDFPLTINSIAFVLDLSRRLNVTSPKDTRLLSVISSIYSKHRFSRKDVAKFLSEVGRNL